jgi:hypothetical protein
MNQEAHVDIKLMPAAYLGLKIGVKQQALKYGSEVVTG